MKLTLQRLTLENFKGQNTDFQFSGNTYILGKNGSGKTTQYDAFLWLLFGKDSLGRTDYKIKPLLPDWTEEHHVTVSVTGFFSIDGQQLTLKRIYTEKWPKKKGAEEAEYDGDKTDYEYNGVPCNQTEYKAKVSAFVDETLFRLITSASYFNSLEWKKRRDMLLQAAGEPTNEEVATGNEKFMKLLSLCSGKLLDDYRREVNAKKKPIKKELDGIPFAIKEVEKQIFEKDWSTFEKTLTEKTSEIKALQDGIDNENQRVQDANKETNQRIQTLLNEISELERKKMEIENRYKTAYNKETSDLRIRKESLSRDLPEIERRISRNKEIEGNNRKLIEEYSISRKAIGEQYTRIGKGDIEESDKICHACGTVLVGDNLKNVVKNLLSAVAKEGFRLKEQIEECSKFSEEAAEENKKLNAKRDALIEDKKAADEIIIKHFVSSTNEDVEYKELIKSIADKKETIDIVADSAEKSGDLSEAKDRITALGKEVQSIQRELYGKQVIESSRDRLTELRKKEKDLSIELASLEKIEISADQFIKRKLDMMEDKVNAMFSIVKWRMYEPQVNGGEKEICECGIDGIAFGSLNTAAKINAGLDIANTFSRINNVYAPIWIDNRESVTDIMPVESQTISLVVSPEHEVLTIKQ